MGAPVVRGGADILRDWGMNPRAQHAVSRQEELPEGDRLALLLKEEIAGACATKGGETYWRA
jgi:hypothetical protein